MSERISKEHYGFLLSFVVAERASCPRKQVGAVIIEQETGRIVSTGYNGAPSKEPHCIDVGCDIVDGHCKRAVHAEKNALKFMPIDDVLLSNVRGGYVMYCNLEPCGDCLQDIINNNIEVRWAKDYESDCKCESCTRKASIKKELGWSSSRESRRYIPPRSEVYQRG